jgi:hypothetical protein
LLIGGGGGISAIVSHSVTIISEVEGDGFLSVWQLLLSFLGHFSGNKQNIYRCRLSTHVPTYKNCYV